MKPAQYKVTTGSHYDQSGREYTQGNIVESWSDLCAAFTNKFTLVKEADLTPEAAVVPLRTIVQPVQPVVPKQEEVIDQTPPAAAPAAEAPAETETAEAETPKKKRKTVNLD